MTSTPPSATRTASTRDPRAPCSPLVTRRGVAGGKAASILLTFLAIICGFSRAVYSVPQPVYASSANATAEVSSWAALTLQALGRPLHCALVYKPGIAPVLDKLQLGVLDGFAFTRTNTTGDTSSLAYRLAVAAPGTILPVQRSEVDGASVWMLDWIRRRSGIDVSLSAVVLPSILAKANDPFLQGNYALKCVLAAGWDRTQAGLTPMTPAHSA